MFRSKLRFSFVSLALTALGAAAVPWSGCGVSASSICNRVCECEGCSKSDLAECIDEVEDEEKKAEDEGCSDQYGAMLSCYDSEFECQDDDVDVDGCDSEEEALSKCLRKTSFSGGSGGETETSSGTGGTGGGEPTGPCEFTDDGGDRRQRLRLRPRRLRLLPRRGRTLRQYRRRQRVLQRLLRFAEPVRVR
jgi:hypothetical protein